MNLEADRYFVRIRHRPRRLAFLVDADQCPDALLNEIVDFNVACWGGRHNPVIPVLNGEVTDSYWQLLSVIDPDCLYSYSELPAALLARIQSDIQPLEVVKHRFTPGGIRQFRVRLEEQADVIPALRQVVENIPKFARKPDPAVLLFDTRDIEELGSFALRNFGWCPQLNIWCRDN